jgi:hypothetical protein
MSVILRLREFSVYYTKLKEIVGCENNPRGLCCILYLEYGLHMD